MRLLPIFVAATLLSSQPTWAWNGFGHQVIAARAYKQLTPASKARVSELLKLNPNYSEWIENIEESDQNEAAFIRASTWPDYIKRAKGYKNDGSNPSGPNAARNIGYSDKLMHRYWHYVDIPFSSDSTSLQQPEEPNAKTQMAAFCGVLSDPSASDELKSYDLVWLVHLVGDVHQPLHATSRFTHDHPNGDAGGNDVILCSASACDGNLHAYWDGILGKGNNVDKINKFANYLPAPTAEQVAISDIDVWIEESAKAAQKIVYTSPIESGKGPFTLTTAYKINAKTLARKQAALAADRLARLINQALE